MGICTKKKRRLCLPSTILGPSFWSIDNYYILADLFYILPGHFNLFFTYPECRPLCLARHDDCFNIAALNIHNQVSDLAQHLAVCQIYYAHALQIRNLHIHPPLYRYEGENKLTPKQKAPRGFFRDPP